MEEMQQLTPDQIKQLVQEAIADPAEYAKMAATKMPEDLVHLVNTLLITALLIANKELVQAVKLLLEKEQAREKEHSQD